MCKVKTGMKMTFQMMKLAEADVVEDERGG